MDVNQLTQVTTDIALRFGLKLLGAIVVFVVGRRLIDLSVRLISNALARREVDPTVLRYVGSAVSVMLNVALVIAILGYFGVETTTFAALVAAAGVAIGMAWSGLLAHFAAGAFIVVLRPFKVGDFVSAGGVTGTVREIGLFGTTIVTPDNVVTTVGNSKVLGDTIQNFSANPYRRVDLTVQAHHGADPLEIRRLLTERLAKIANVLSEPPPECEILHATLAGPVFTVRAYSHTEHYWQVYFDATRAVAQAFAEAGFPAPATVVMARSGA
jgi:small conductance mechanosensitive channel